MQRNLRTMPNQAAAEMSENTRSWENSKELEIARCQGKPCNRKSVYIMTADDRVTVNHKYYHKGCEPTLS